MFKPNFSYRPSRSVILFNLILYAYNLKEKFRIDIILSYRSTATFTQISWYTYYVMNLKNITIKYMSIIIVIACIEIKRTNNWPKDTKLNLSHLHARIIQDALYYIFFYQSYRRRTFCHWFADTILFSTKLYFAFDVRHPRSGTM